MEKSYASSMKQDVIYIGKILFNILKNLNFISSELPERTMAQEGHSPVLVFDSPVMVLHSLVLVFTQSSFIFLHSPVLIFTQSSFNFYTVQFYFFTQSSFNFHTVQFYFFTQSSFNFYTVQFFSFTQSSFISYVVTRPLSRCCNTCYLMAAILYFLATMDSIIRQAVREELRRSNCSRPETASSTNQDDQGRSENESGAAGSSRSSFSSRTVSRLSGLLNRMRKGGGK